MKGKRKILFQIGIVVFVVFFLIIVITEYIVYSQNTNIYLTAKNEMIDKDLETIEENLYAVTSNKIVEYIAGDTKNINGELSDTEYEWLYDQEELWEDRKTDEGRDRYDRFFEGLDEEHKIIIAKYDCNLLGTMLWTTVYEKGYDDVYIIRPVNRKEAVVLSYDSYAEIKEKYKKLINNSETDASESSASDDSANEGKKSQINKKYEYGQIIDFDLDDRTEIDHLIKNKKSDSSFEKRIETDGTAYYIGYHTVFSDGELEYIVCVEYDWSEVYSSFIGNVTKNLIRNTLVGFGFSATVILLCLFFITVKPLKQVKDTMDLYMSTKNSEDVENKLSTLKSRNEIGDLAEHFRELTKEMDRYTAENVALAEDKARIKTELNLAASIQGQALIKEFPDSDCYEISASMNPAKEVGGDFYDVFDIDEDHLALVIGDVSGKGVPAALMMMAGITLIRSFANPGVKPSEVLSKVNESIVQKDFDKMFITIWMGILDKKTGVLTTSNAGHEYPALKQSDSYELYKDRHGLVAGGMKGVKYFDHEIQLKEGDMVFVYTDGVPEANNSSNELFGDERMLEALNKNADASPDEVLANVKEAVDAYVGEAEQFDDLTMLCIKYHQR
ncbi:MAG: PP2C family protein-serine/threonine phosphatase [Eubacterium sp.]|nr:PP2C family protein-serine/threonine phosphatase [Eubacterium sp.]